MGELPDLLGIDFKTEVAGSMILGFRKLAYALQFGLKKKILIELFCMGLVKNANHFTVCFDELLDHISNFYQLDAPILCYNEIVYCVERAHHESFFMGHGNAESGLEKLKET